MSEPFAKIWAEILTGLEVFTDPEPPTREQVTAVFKELFYFGGRAAIQVQEDGGNPLPEIDEFMQKLVQGSDQ